MLTEETRAYLAEQSSRRGVVPEYLQLLLLDDIYREQRRIRELAEDQRPQGLLWSMDPFVLTVPRGIEVRDGTKDIRLFSVTVMNDGAGSLRFGFNSTDRTPILVNVLETRTITFARGVIESLILTPVAGATPTVRIFGTY
ncbi:MAG: hypothetical protein C4534_08225 [Gaiellales bacterium]|nr:MAG: hypothetical protein C4534_08225 [Gaiellales bacterium]